MSNRHGARFISFASPKGGVGKSTSCLAIAGALLAAGEKVRIIDFDQTETIWRWYTTNAGTQHHPNLTVEQGPKTDHGYFVNDLWNTATGYVLLDLAGSLSDLTLTMAAFATLTITPAKVSEPDIMEANKMANKLHAVASRLNKPIQHRILLNEIPNIVSRDEVELVEQIDASNLARFATIIRRRSAYSKSFSNGTLPHFAPQPNPKAIAEIDALMQEIQSIFQLDEQKVAA